MCFVTEEVMFIGYIPVRGINYRILLTRRPLRFTHVDYDRNMITVAEGSNVTVLKRLVAAVRRIERRAGDRAAVPAYPFPFSQAQRGKDLQRALPIPVSRLIRPSPKHARRVRG
jgi:hypothetical protein